MKKTTTALSLALFVAASSAYADKLGLPQWGLEGAVGAQTRTLGIYDWSAARSFLPMATVDSVTKTVSISVSASNLTFIASGANAATRTIGSKLADVASIKDYGGFASSATITCNTTAGSATLTCSGGVGDFAEKQGVFIYGAGADASGFPTPTVITPVTCGAAAPTWPCATGSTTYRYRIIPIATNGARGAPSSVVSVADGPATLSALQFVTLTWTPASPASPAMIIQQERSPGIYSNIDIVGILASVNDYGADGVFSLDKFPAHASWLSQTDSGNARGWLTAQIVSASGTTIVLDRNAEASLTGVTLNHDNTIPLQNALNATSAVRVPCGTYQFVGDMVNLNTNNALIGESARCSKFHIMAGLLDSGFLRGVSDSNVSIENLTIDGRDVPQHSRNALISCTTCNDLLVSGNEIKGFMRFGYSGFGGSYKKIVNNKISLTTPFRSQNQCVNEGESSLTRNMYEIIAGNTCVNTGMWPSISRSILAQNIVHGAGFGTGWGLAQLGAVYSENDVVANNISAENGTGEDVNFTKVSPGEFWGAGHVIANNVGVGNYNGFHVGSQDTIWSGNLAQDNGEFGFGCKDVSPPNECTRNVFIGNKAFDTGAFNAQGTGFQSYSISDVKGLMLKNNDWRPGSGGVSVDLVRGNELLSADFAAVNTTTLAFVQVNASTDTMWHNLESGLHYRVKFDADLTLDATGGMKIGLDAVDTGGGALAATNYRVHARATCKSTNAVIVDGETTSTGGTFSYSAGCTSVHMTLTATFKADEDGQITPWFAQAVANGTSTILAGAVMTLERLY